MEYFQTQVDKHVDQQGQIQTLLFDFGQLDELIELDKKTEGFTVMQKMMPDRGGAMMGSPLDGPVGSPALQTLKI